MQVTITTIRRYAIVLAAPLLASLVLLAVPGQTGSEPQTEDAAVFYKGKCVACHGAKAEKKFDASLPDDQLIEVVLKGKKAEKPPNMPNYETKGVTADQAKALVTYMKQLKAAAAE